MGNQRASVGQAITVYGGAFVAGFGPAGGALAALRTEDTPDVLNVGLAVLAALLVSALAFQTLSCALWHRPDLAQVLGVVGYGAMWTYAGFVIDNPSAALRAAGAVLLYVAVLTNATRGWRHDFRHRL